MSWTKQQFVNRAFEEIGMANYNHSLQADQLNAALVTLDALMADWNARGIRLGYPLPSSPEDSALSEETNVPDFANLAIAKNLAIEIAPTVGKNVSPLTMKSADRGMRTVTLRTLAPRERQISGMPAGAGHRYRGSKHREFLPPATDPLRVGDDDILDLEG